MEQIRGLEYELEINYKVTKNIITEKILLDFYKFDYEEKIEKLKLDLKRNKILLKDPQNKLATGNYHFRNRKVIIQMKNQVEEVENEQNSAIKIKKNLEEEFFELQDKLDEVTQLKQSTDKKYFEISRENVSLVAMVKDYEEIMKKYKARVSSLSSQMTFR